MVLDMISLISGSPFPCSLGSPDSETVGPGMLTTRVIDGPASQSPLNDV